MYFALAIVIGFLMLCSAVLHAQVLVFWVFYPLYFYAVFKAIDGIPFWRLDRSVLARFAISGVNFGGAACYFLIAILVNLFWWLFEPHSLLYALADGVWRLLAPVMKNPDLVFDALYQTRHFDFSEKAKLMYGLSLLFFMLTLPGCFGLYSWFRFCRGGLNLTGWNRYSIFLGMAVIVWRLQLGPINWDFQHCGLRCGDAGARLASKGDYSLFWFYTAFPFGMFVLLMCILGVLMIFFESKKTSDDWSWS